MQYRAVNTSLRHYELRDANDSTLGSMEIKAFFTTHVDMILRDERTLHIAPKGFWGNTFELSEQDRPMMQIHFDWPGTITLTTPAETGYQLKRKDIWHPHHVMYNNNGIEMMAIRPDHQWTKLKTHYDIDVNPDLTNVLEPLTILTSIAAISIMAARTSGAIAGSMH